MIEAPFNETGIRTSPKDTDSRTPTEASCRHSSRSTCGAPPPNVSRPVAGRAYLSRRSRRPGRRPLASPVAASRGYFGRCGHRPQRNAASVHDRGALDAPLYLRSTGLFPAFSPPHRRSARRHSRRRAPARACRRSSCRVPGGDGSRADDPPCLSNLPNALAESAPHPCAGHDSTPSGGSSKPLVSRILQEVFLRSTNVASATASPACRSASNARSARTWPPPRDFSKSLRFFGDSRRVHSGFIAAC